MVRLIIGGAHNGKSAYLQTLLVQNEIVDGGSCPILIPVTTKGVDKLHLLIRRWLAAGQDSLAQVQALVDSNPEIIFVCDELGCGVVPMDREERDWRDAVGQACLFLAAQATLVERVFCGIPQVIKCEMACE